MQAKRIIIASMNSAHTLRHIEYAMALGATVMHIGYEPIYQTNAPDTYSFEPFFAELSAVDRLASNYQSEMEHLLEREAQRLAALARDFGADLCHVLGMDILYQLFLRAKLRPLIISVHGYLEHLVYGTPELRERDRALFNTDAVVAEPPMLVDLLRSLLPPSIHVEEFAIGMDCHKFRPVDAKTRAGWRRVLQVPPEAIAILSPRGWSERYNHHRVLAAFAKALPELPAPAYLIFLKMGRGMHPEDAKNYAAQVEQQAEELGVTDRVRWLPSIPPVAMPPIYNASDLVISFCTPDTFSNTVLEVMACERPIIVPALPTYPGSVIAKHCRMTPMRKIDALAENIIDMVLHPPSAEALAAARQDVMAQYDKPAVMRQLEVLYDNVTSRT